MPISNTDAPVPSDALEQLTGLIEQVTFHNAESGLPF